MATFTRIVRWFLAVAIVPALLAACGGSSSSSSPESENPETTTTISGNVELVSGTAIAYSQPWPNRLFALLIPSVQADIVGLIDAPDGTPVRLIRIGNDGNEVDQLATTETLGGRFTIETELGAAAAGDLIIEAGPPEDPVRAPAGGENLTVNPVSSSIVNKVVERVQAGGSFSDFKASDLANLIHIIIDELDVTFAVSNANAATQADTEAGDVDDNLVASVEGENSVANAFVGDKNLAAIDVLLEAFGDNAGFAVLNNTLAPTITESLRLDASGVTSEDARTERFWTFTEGSGVTSSGSQSTTTDTGASGQGFDITVGSDGRLFAQGGNIRGAVSQDGELFAMANTATELGGNGAAFGLFAGASTWGPGDLTETFNFVKFDGYVDKDFTDDQVGYTNTLRGEIDMGCAAGSCDFDLDRLGAESRKFYSQLGPETTTIDTNESSNINLLQLANISLSGEGSLGGMADVIVDGTASGVSYRTRGFVAPDSGMLVMQLSGEDQTLFEDFIVGLPQPGLGDSCTAANLQGAYNTVWLTGVMNENGPTVAVESEAVLVEADGAGALDFSASSFREAVISFNGTNTGLSRGVTSDTGDQGIPYSVEADCKLSIIDETGDRALGAVSPDGRAFILATYRVESNGSQTFQSLAIGLR